MKIFSQCANCLFLNREKTSIFNECNTSFVGIFMICFTHLNLKKKKIPIPRLQKNSLLREKFKIGLTGGYKKYKPPF